MKRLYCLLFAVILMILQPVTAFANVGMIYSENRKGAEFFVNDEHPLIVESEQLTFDVHARKVSNAKALWSDVTASYTVTNPTAEAVEVQAVFPVVLTTIEEEPNIHEVQLDGENVPYHLVSASVDLAEFENMEFSELLRQISDADYSSQNTVLLQFALHFEPYQTSTLQVSSVTSAQSEHDMIYELFLITRSEYTFRYFLSPAKHWADFKDLTITIHAPSAAPFLTESSLDFRLSGWNTYTAHCDTLPDGNLSFTLTRSMPYSFAILAGVVLVLMTIRYIVRKRK